MRYRGILFLLTVLFLVEGVLAQGVGVLNAEIGYIVRLLFNFVGIGTALALIYYSRHIYRKAQGEGTIAETSKYVLVGSAAFLMVYLGITLMQLFNVNIWYFAEITRLVKMWNMWLYAITVTMFALAYRRMIQ